MIQLEDHGHLFSLFTFLWASCLLFRYVFIIDIYFCIASRQVCCGEVGESRKAGDRGRREEGRTDDGVRQGVARENL